MATPVPMGGPLNRLPDATLCTGTRRHQRDPDRPHRTLCRRLVAGMDDRRHSDGVQYLDLCVACWRVAVERDPLRPLSRVLR